MPLPFIPVAIALGGAALFGAKKGYDGYSNLSDAKKMDEESQAVYKQQERLLDNARVSTNRQLEDLGRAKIAIYTEGSVSRFIEVASQIKNMPDKELDGLFEQAKPVSEVLQELKNTRVHFVELAGGMLASAGTGALASIGALGSVSFFAAAGTGTAISALSGVAATNATLAWLGGGTLAAGGFGMAGGMAMIGGIAVAPMILVGGWLMASKGEKALEQAKENRAKVEAFVNSVKAICTNLELISRTSSMMTSILHQMDELFGEYVDRLDSLVSVNDDYRAYTEQEKSLVKNCFLFNQHMVDLVETKLMDQEGSFIQDAVKNIEANSAFIEKMNSL